MSFEEWAVAHARMSSKPHRAAKLDDKMSFFHQLSTLVCAGTPLLQAIKICAEQNQSLKMRKVLGEIASRVASGCPLNTAAASFPKVFEYHWIEVIRTGEVTGKMGTVLVELNKEIRESRETKKKVMGSLMYPMILIFVAVTAVTVMLWLVVPTFAKMFQDVGAELPGPTQFLVDISAFLVAYGVYMVAGVVAVVVGLKLYLRTESGRTYFIAAGLVLPMVGELIVQMAMYRFASTISLLLKSGVPMLETMGTMIGVFHTNPIYRKAMQQTQARVASGRPLAASLEETGLFSPMLTNMVRVGEESGQLAAVMEQIAPFFKEKMESLVLKVTKMLEPIIIMGMGSSIAGIMLAIYMPMFEMAGKVK
jgi:type IV pilus assembly protein PilC